MTFHVSRQLFVQRCHWPQVNRVSDKPVEYQVKVERMKSDGVMATESKPIQIPEVCCFSDGLMWLEEALGARISATFVISNHGNDTSDGILPIAGHSACISSVESVATGYITIFDLFADYTVWLRHLSQRFVPVADNLQFARLFAQLPGFSWLHPEVVDLKRETNNRSFVREEQQHHLLEECSQF